ncbi:hypothetical protein DFH27DRAFT_45372 [Peziza echinospora]|nr:hypothetical protein DFH27DRAFT_45372 [Peziza echinospora]
MDNGQIPPVPSIPLKITTQDRNIPQYRQAKSAPSSPRRARRVPPVPSEDVPDLKVSLERLNTKKVSDSVNRNLRTATSASTISSVRGQNFTVGNISNGLIYLRPVVRPPHEKHILLHPTTPPNSAEERPGQLWENERTLPEVQRENRRENRHRPSSPPRTPPRQKHRHVDSSDFYMKTSPPVPTRSQHHRAYSFSTATGRSTPTAPDFEGYRVVIDRVETQRPKTAGPEPPFDGLHVKIPHYTLGSPHFSPHGTPFLHGSSSVLSSSLLLPSTKGELGSTSNSQITEFKWFSPGDERSKMSSSPIPLLPDRENSPFASPPPSMPSPIRQIPTPNAITPQIFDTLSFPPYSEHPSVVKYDARNKQILAATPPRIIAQITSATFLDYQLLSDFFLTYRLFMTPSDLVAYLITRLRWAIDRHDDIGRVVRVRTFVAIRHWLLNYFGDDFVPSLSLRQKFVSALNELAVSVIGVGSESDLKIIGELKKCWRRTCALYWDDHKLSQDLSTSINMEIFPGGPPGLRSEEVPEPAPEEAYPFRPSTSLHLPRVPLEFGSSGSLDGIGTDPTLWQFSDTKPLNKKKSAKQLAEKFLHKASSDASIHSTSKAPKKAIPTSFPPHAAKTSPNATSSLLTQIPTGSTRPKSNAHKRSGSFSDALRDHRQPLPLQNSLARSTHILMAFPYAGSSLVRGTLLPPTPANVEVIAPSTPVPDGNIYLSSGTSLSSSSSGVHEQYDSPHHHNKLGLGGPGMKKFLDGLKKALIGKAPNGYGHNHGGIYSPVPISKQGSGSNISESDSMARYLDENYIRHSLSAGSRIDGRSRAASVGDGRLARVDLLGAGVVDAFQRVCREEGISDDMSSENHGPIQNRSYKSRPPLRRATIDTAIGESVQSDYDEMSTVGDYALTPQTRRRGNTLRTGGLRPTVLTPMGERGETPIPPCADDNSNNSVQVIITSDGLSSPAALSSSTVGSGTSSEHGQAKETPKASILPMFADDNLFGRRSEHSYMSSHLQPRSRRHSESSHVSNYEDFSDTSSLAGKPNDDDDLQPQNNRLLRRMPGGLLRKAETVADLEIPIRPKSVGTFSTFSQSASIYSFNAPPQPNTTSFGNAPSDTRTQKLAAGVVSLGAVAKGGGVHFLPEEDEQKPTAPDTPTTAKELFEQGVMKLAALLDTESDDGGIEVALMKLEGRYDRRASKAMDVSSRPTSDAKPLDGHRSTTHVSEHLSDTSEYERPTTIVGTRKSFVGDKSLHQPENKPDGEDHGNAQHLRLKRRHKGVVDQVPLETPSALNSDNNSFGFPLGEEAADEIKPIITQFRFPGPKSQAQDGKPHPPRKSSMLKPKQSKEEHTRRISFDESDNDSELSSEISFEMVSHNHSHNRSASFKFPRPTVIGELGISSHPLRHPPSPPLTLEQALGINPDGTTGFYSQRLGTPDHTWKGYRKSPLGENNPRQRNMTRDSIPVLQSPSIHLPFILAYDSQLLAKQFTLIEKDALNEIDWKELVELRWKQTSTSVRDWVEFLKSRNVRGVEVIIARFNLMWKWAMSEIVMTRDIDERARTIVKLIHIAAHARKLQNFATMYQITAALLTSNIARLRRTWKLVSGPDMETFKQLEALIQPVRNFHNLRAEMDKVTGETGCIPFVGLFTHDLIYNAQRPSHLPGGPDGELLVNFEKHRMTASIIKRLLRLTEASHKYDFKPVDGVCERCLWIASLTDDEIKGLSMNLEL